MPIDIDGITANISFREFSESVVFNGAEVRGIPGPELVSLGGYDAMVEERVTLEVMRSEVPDIRQGLPVTIRGQAYRVDRPVEGTTDFGLTVKLLLR